MGLTLISFMTISYGTCYINAISGSEQLACIHSGDSVCTMQGNDCCLTETGSVRRKDSEEPEISSALCPTICEKDDYNCLERENMMEVMR
jgi:hypothetical protein